MLKWVNFNQVPEGVHCPECGSSFWKLLVNFEQRSIASSNQPQQPRSSPNPNQNKPATRGSNRKNGKGKSNTDMSTTPETTSPNAKKQDKPQ